MKSIEYLPSRNNIKSEQEYNNYNSLNPVILNTQNGLADTKVSNLIFVMNPIRSPDYKIKMARQQFSKDFKNKTSSMNKILIKNKSVGQNIPMQFQRLQRNNSCKSKEKIFDDWDYTQNTWDTKEKAQIEQYKHNNLSNIYDGHGVVSTPTLDKSYRAALSHGTSTIGHKDNIFPSKDRESFFPTGIDICSDKYQKLTNSLSTNNLKKLKLKKDSTISKDTIKSNSENKSSIIFSKNNLCTINSKKKGIKIYYRNVDEKHKYGKSSDLHMLPTFSPKDWKNSLNSGKPISVIDTIVLDPGQIPVLPENKSLYCNNIYLNRKVKLSNKKEQGTDTSNRIFLPPLLKNYILRPNFEYDFTSKLPNKLLQFQLKEYFEMNNKMSPFKY